MVREKAKRVLRRCHGQCLGLDGWTVKGIEVANPNNSATANVEVNFVLNEY